MKQQILLTLLFLIVSFFAKAQNYDYATSSLDMIETGQDYSASSVSVKLPMTPDFNYKKTSEWHKYKVLRAVGWSALGVGIPTTFIGAVAMAFSVVEGGDPWGGYIAITAAGGLLTVSSIPILISAYHFRNKAKRMTMDVTLSPVCAPSFTANRMEISPAVGLRFTF